MSLIRIKEDLRKSFASKADAFMDKLRQIEQGIGALGGGLGVSDARRR
jgi:hypothetical protein